MQQQEPQGIWLHNNQTQPARKALHQRMADSSITAATASNANSPVRLLPVTVDDDAVPKHVLAAAGKKAILDLQHQQLVAAFERVEHGLDSWQLATVIEEDSSEAPPDMEEECAGKWQLQAAASAQPAEAARLLGEDQEPVADQTFITGMLGGGFLWARGPG